MEGYAARILTVSLPANAPRGMRDRARMTSGSGPAPRAWTRSLTPSVDALGIAAHLRRRPVPTDNSAAAKSDTLVAKDLPRVA